MKTVNIGQAKADLSRLVEEAAKGGEIIITKAGRPRARLVRCESAPSEAPRKKRKLGWAKRVFVVSDDFDAPMSDEELRLWGMK